MSLLTDPKDIWTVPFESSDIQPAIEYGITSWVWTYDRMGAQARGNYDKAIFRIIIGRAVQNAFARIVKAKGFELEADTTDYKVMDQWDFRTNEGKDVDVKTFNYFTNYRIDRPQLSPALIVNSALGNDWRRFFPMLVPVDQYASIPKEYYAFGIVASRSSEHCSNSTRDAEFVIAQPTSEDANTLRLLDLIYKGDNVKNRTRRGENFSITVKRVDELPVETLTVTIGAGIKDGEAKTQTLDFKRDTEYNFGGLTAFHYFRLHNGCVGSDVLDRVLFEVTFRNVDRAGNIAAVIRAGDLYDVWIHDGTAYFIGWITRDEFAQAKEKHPSYEPASDKKGNTQTRPDGGHLEQGSFWYVVPPLKSGRGGTRKPNYYCLPRDLKTMDSMLKLL